MVHSAWVRFGASMLTAAFLLSAGNVYAAPGDKDAKRQKLLDEFDADGDGKISPAEAAKIRKANAAKRDEARRGPGGEGRERGAVGREGRGPRGAGEGPPRGGFRAVISMNGREMVFTNPREAMIALHRMMGGQGPGPGGPGFDGRGGPRGGPPRGEGVGRKGPPGGGEGRGRGGQGGGERGKRGRD